MRRTQTIGRLYFGLQIFSNLDIFHYADSFKRKPTIIVARIVPIGHIGRGQSFLAATGRICGTIG